MALEDEFSLIEKKIDKLLVTHKKNSDDYKIIGMLDEYDASKIIDGSIRIIRKQLKIITMDYSINKKQIVKINNFLDKIREKLNNEVLDEDILIHNYGIRENEYGIVEERTIDEAYYDFVHKSREKLDSISIQKIRLNNFNIRKRTEKWKYWLPISISIISLIISIISIYIGGSK